MAPQDMTNASAEDRTHHAISILLVLTLHALLILALLRFLVSPQNFVFTPQTHLPEMFINTARPPAPAMRKEAPRPAPPRAARPASKPLAPSEAPAMPVPDIKGFGQVLDGCAPQNFANLDDAQRSRCQSLGLVPSHDLGAVDYADRTAQVPGAKQWERELARKKAPLLLPCGNPVAFDPVYTGFCIIGNIANGFTFKKQYQNQRAYFDRSGKLRN